MPLAEWVVKRNNAQPAPSSSNKRLSVQEAQALKFTSDRPYSPGLYDRNGEQKNALEAVTGTTIGPAYNKSHQLADQSNTVQQITAESDANARMDPLTDLMETRLATMAQQEGDEAGLRDVPMSSFMHRRRSVQSYPSTTSGRPDGSEHDTRSLASGSPSTFRFSRPARPFAMAGIRPSQEAAQERDVQGHSAQDKQGLHLAYHTAHGTQAQCQSVAVAGNKRKSSHDTDLAPAFPAEADISCQTQQAFQFQDEELADIDDIDLLSVSDYTESELDYEPTTLFNMNFKDLQQEPFDQDHHPDLALGRRLQQHFEKPTEEQQQFFDSLSFGEWEEAGAWFEDKFKAFTEKLRRSREERRELARRFEEEVARRYEVVSSETSNVDKRLAEMGQRGAQVLAPVSVERQ